MGNCRAQLGLDIVAYYGHSALFKSLAPVFLFGDENRNAVDHGAPGFQDLLHVPFGGHFAAHR